MGGNKYDGVLTTDKNGVIVGYDGNDMVIEEAVEFGQTVKTLAGRAKLLTFVPVDDVNGPTAKPQRTLSEIFARAGLRGRMPGDGRPGGPRPGGPRPRDEVEFSGSGLIAKADEEQQVVYGWAYVTHDQNGKVVVDESGDFVDEVEEIEKTGRHRLT